MSGTTTVDRRAHSISLIRRDRSSYTLCHICSFRFYFICSFPFRYVYAHSNTHTRTHDTKRRTHVRVRRSLIVRLHTVGLAIEANTTKIETRERRRRENKNSFMACSLHLQQFNRAQPCWQGSTGHTVVQPVSEENKMK